MSAAVSAAPPARRTDARGGGAGTGAVFRAARGGLGGRRLQAVIIGLVVLAATAASTLALGMLVDAHSPFDHAFVAQRGADVTATIDTSSNGVTPASLNAATRVAGATAVTGPLATGTVNAQFAIPGISGSVTTSFQLTGRTAPGGPVDDLVLEQGTWPQTDSQIVLSETANVPTGIGSTATIGHQTLTVVGIATSVTDTSDAWVLPAEMSVISGPGGSGQAQILYRFANAGTSAQVADDIAEVNAALPKRAVSAVSYLEIRQSEQSSVAPWVPFIVAFGIIALVISVLIVVNVVSGAVGAGTSRIGVLKSIGFTPSQVVTAYVLLVAVPAVIGAIVGVIVGNLLATPLLRQNATVYQVGALGVPFWVDAAVPAAVLALTVAAAVGPALRAGRMSAITAIATGRAPQPTRGFFAQRALAKLTRIPRPVTLGLAAPTARPGRTMITVIAVLCGAAAVTFGVGLSTSLNRAFHDLNRGQSLPVEVNAAIPPGASPPHGNGQGQVKVGGVGNGGGGLTSAQQRAIVTAIDAQSGTLHAVAISNDTLALPGLPTADNAGGVRVTAYSGDPAWTGLALIGGRWYTAAPGAEEIDANTLFLTDTNTTLGDTYTIANGTHKVTVTIVGEVFAPTDSPEIYSSPSTLTKIDPAVTGPSEVGVAIKPGVNAQAYANTLSNALGANYNINTQTGGAKALLAVVTLVTLLTLLIIVVAALGVLNTVALQIRERAHDIGVYKALGMTPRQTLTMVTWSVAIPGLIAGLIAVPVGIRLHNGVIPEMTNAVNSGYPQALIHVYSIPELTLLSLAGLVIAVLGALAPATWAANARTATALRTE